MLKDKQGAAFVVEPARGTLGPYQSQEISVTVYCDMWGEYKDVLSCQVEGWRNVAFTLFATRQRCALFRPSFLLLVAAKIDMSLYR